jgi:glutamine amidotransferase-like uncharacterized protein
MHLREKIKEHLQKHGFEFEIIDEVDVANFKKLSGFSLIIFPGGHHVDVGKNGDNNIRKFVRNGGSFLGICAGMHYGCDLKLLDVSIMYMRGKGKVVLMSPQS